jgi:hypothetical protein
MDLTKLGSSMIQITDRSSAEILTNAAQEFQKDADFFSNSNSIEKIITIKRSKKQRQFFEQNKNENIIKKY